MKCFSPVHIKNPHYETKPGQNFIMTIRCRKCAGCKATKRSEWYIRIRTEAKQWNSCHFVTLTYADEFLPYVKYRAENGTTVPIPGLSKRDLQLFLKRLRKNTRKKVKYFAVGEYGEKSYRPHYHLILFGLDQKQIYDDILLSWKKGHVRVDPVNDARIRYVTGYVLKKDDREYFEQDQYQKPYMVCSKKLGLDYVRIMKDWHKADLTRNYVPLEGGKRMCLPDYYRDKIYTEAEKKQQAELVEKLDQKKFEHLYIHGDSDFGADQKIEIEYKLGYTRRENKKLKSRVL